MRGNVEQYAGMDIAGSVIGSQPDGALPRTKYHPGDYMEHCDDLDPIIIAFRV